MSKRNTGFYDGVSKKQKLTPKSNNFLQYLAKDEFSHIITFLTIGEVIMLSLSCKSINNLLKEHLQTIHPYVINSYPSAEEKNTVEWTIARALQTHRRLNINEESINSVNEIFDSIIGNKEPFEKLFKQVKVFNENLELEIEEILKLFSKPTGQSRENVKFVTISFIDKEEETPDSSMYKLEYPISIRNLQSIPIGFLVKELIICNFSISKTSIFEILSQFHSLEKLKLELEPFNGDTNVEVPLLENLKHLEIYVQCNPALELFYNLVKLTPNLEYLDISYYEQPPGDDFLLFLTQKCPNLKGISFQVTRKEAEELIFTDLGIINFLKGEPKLEYLGLDAYCCNVSGKLLTKIGQFSNLRSISINRNAHLPRYLPIQTELHFGGGILKNLEYISLDGFSIDSEAQAGTFLSSIIKRAPNIKNIDNVCSFDYVDVYEFMDELSPLLSVFIPALDDIKNLKRWLKKSKQLEEIEFLDNADLSKIEPVTTVKKLKLPSYCGISYRDLSRVFPSITELDAGSSNETQLIEILKEGKWPELKYYSKVSTTITEIRPNLYGSLEETTWEFIENCRLENEAQQFVKEWLILDEVVYNNYASKMSKFFKNVKDLQ